uniref:Leucokinin receptor n=2 Tax=Aplysia californica TaxID=6500 RepID=A0A977Q7Q2_APLCA|nr:leucokinin receptor [Aplysia californica]
MDGLGAVAEQAAFIIVEDVSRSNNGDNSTSSFSSSSSLSSSSDSIMADLLGTNTTASSLPGNTTDSEPYDVPTGLMVLLAFLYGSISLMAVIGNGLVILVIVKNRRMHTVTNIFIANLAVADVIIGIFSIPFQFQAAILQRWVLANFLCSLAPFVQLISVNVSIFTLTVIAVDRYIAVIHPFKAGCSKRSAAIIISVIWTVAVGSGVPISLVYWVENNNETNFKDMCKEHELADIENFNLVYNTIMVSLQYLLPLTVITFCYCRIAWRIWGSRRPGAHVTSEDVRGRNKRKVVKMMIIVVCLFVLCWLPLQTYNMVQRWWVEINYYTYINIIWFASNWLAMSNSCYNPFIYGLLNEKFKREFRLLFASCPCGVKGQGEYYTEYFSEDANQCRRANNNHNGPANRHGAVRYNFYRDEKKAHGDDTETSQI